MLLGIHPEHIQLCSEAEADLPMHVRAVESLGAETLIHGILVADEQHQTPIVVRLAGIHYPEIGSRLWLQLPNQHWHLFDQTSQQRVN